MFVILKFSNLKPSLNKLLNIRMSDHIPFDIQSEIIKSLPVKSLVQFRSVSKRWKSFIDNPEFIKTYHVNHHNPQHHLLIRYKTDSVTTYTSIIDDNTFPQQKFPLTAPELLKLLKYTRIIGSADGLLCFYGTYKAIELETEMVIVWNPSVRKCVVIPIPGPFGTGISFGVCPETNDPMLVMLKAAKNSWEVQVFPLSSRVWNIVYTGAPFKKPCHFGIDHVFIDGIIYWSTQCSFIISFDLKNEKFAEVCLPERLVIPLVLKVNESLGLLEFYREGGMSVCGVWMKKDGLNQPFTKIYTVKVEGKSMLYRVIGFRNNGEVVLQLDDDDSEGFQIEVYEPSSGCISRVGISGECRAFSARSYVETLLLLDESNSIIQ